MFQNSTESRNYLRPLSATFSDIEKAYVYTRKATIEV